MTFRYANPVTTREDQALRDPFILKVGRVWWMTGTAPPFWTGPSPGVPLFRSEDLLEWTFDRMLIDVRTLAADCPYDGRFWAPEIHRKGEAFYLTVNSGRLGPEHGERRMDDHNVWIFVADVVQGPYIPLHGPLDVGFKNDASLFTDGDGRSYLYASGGGLWQAEIDLSTGRLRNPLERIVGPKDPSLPDWMVGGIEGPYVLEHGGTYFLLFSAWTRGYEIGTLVAPSPLGPWTLSPREPIFGTRKRRFREAQARRGGYNHVRYDDTDDPFVETGHAAVFEGPDGRPWLCCHYALEGERPIAGLPEGIVEYADRKPQLGIEPIAFEGGRIAVQGPTWTPQEIHLDKSAENAWSMLQ